MNLILLTLDSLRKDRLNFYNKESNIFTLYINKLAEKSIVFYNMITASTCTDPSVASIMTGVYPNKHKVINLADKLKIKDIPTLAEILKENNFTTVGFVAVEHLNSYFCFNRGFDYFFDHNHTFIPIDPILRKKIPFIKIKNKEVDIQRLVKFVIKKIFDEETKNRLFVHCAPGDVINTKVKRFFEKHKIRDRLFLWIHYFDIHMRWDYKGGIKEPFKEKLPPEDLLYYNNIYDSSVIQQDKILGQLFSILEEYQLLDNSIIVVTADHGEYIFDNPKEPIIHEGHGRTLYECEINVPFILYLPKKNNYIKKIYQQTRTVDIMPTLLSLLGIKKEKETDGIDLSPLLKGEEISSEMKKRLDIAISSTYPVYLRAYSVRTPDWKFIYYVDQPERNALYKMSPEPDETTNYYGEEYKIANELSTVLSKYLSAPVQLPKPEDESIKEMLSSLGYL